MAELDTSYQAHIPPNERPSLTLIPGGMLFGIASLGEAGTVAGAHADATTIVTSGLESGGIWGEIYRAAAHTIDPRAAALGAAVTGTVFLINDAVKTERIIHNNQSFIGGDPVHEFSQTKPMRALRGAGTLATAGGLGYLAYRIGGHFNNLQDLYAQIGVFGVSALSALGTRFHFNRTHGGIIKH